LTSELNARKIRSWGVIPAPWIRKESQVKTPATPLPWLHNETTRRPLVVSGYYARICNDEGRDAETIAIVPFARPEDTVAERDAAYIAHAANAYPQLVAALHNVHAALVENGAEANLANIISDAAALLASLGEQS
jgi:hypothetical protein